MKNSSQRSTKRVPEVEYDPSLDKYKDVVLFPGKLAKANEMLKNAKIPQDNWMSNVPEVKKIAL